MGDKVGGGGIICATVVFHHGTGFSANKPFWVNMASYTLSYVARMCAVIKFDVPKMTIPCHVFISVYIV